MAIFSIFAFVWVNSAMLGHPDGVDRSVGRSVAASARRARSTIDRHRATPRARRGARRARTTRARSRSIGRARDDGDGGVRDATDDRSGS